MERQIQDIIALLKRTYERDAWHGPSVQESLKNIQQEQAFNNVPNTHSIIQLVSHMVTWRKYVIHMLKGDAIYKVDEASDFPMAENWMQVLQQLAQTQQELLLAIENFPSEKLHQQVPGKTVPLTFFTLIHGIIHHDLYHTGQIMLIKKATGIQTI
jgi:uncharacterized damage-inducible protein DinB